MRLNFTQAALEQLQPKEKQYDVIDTKIGGLYLRVNPGGTKTYNLYRKILGRSTRIKIGRFCDFSVIEARTRAMKMNVQIADGINPQHERRAARQELTLKELGELYYTQHALVETKDPERYKRMFDLHVVPFLGNHKLSHITREMLKQRHIEIGGTNQPTANHVLNHISTIYNFGIRESYYKGNNPCIGIKRFRSYSRDRFLNKDELKSFFKAVNQEDTMMRDYFLALLYTGVRKSNLLSAKYEDMDFDLKRWRIAEGNTKNKEVNIVMLSDAALEIFNRRAEENKNAYQPSPYVFPGYNPEIHFKTPDLAWGRIVKLMKVKNLRIHDLRRTLASYMAMSGASMPIIGKALNHKSQAATSTYARLANEPVMEAIEAAMELMNEA
jgi:integrase